MDQLSLMANEAEAYAYGTRNATEEQVAVKAHARKRQRRKCAGYRAGGYPHGSGGAPPFRGRAYLRYLRRRDGRDWERGTPELKMEPARFWIREDVYYTYACKQCEAETGEGNLRKTPKQPTLWPG